MAILHEMVIKLCDEGIDGPNDLKDFDKDTLHQVAENCHKPGDQVPNPGPHAPAGSMIL